MLDRLESAHGTKRKCRHVSLMSAIGGQSRRAANIGRGLTLSGRVDGSVNPTQNSSRPPVPVEVDAEAACARLRINRANFAGRPSHVFLDRAERLCVPAFAGRPVVVDLETLILDN